jgi:hypothetical protein
LALALIGQEKFRTLTPKCLAYRIRQAPSIRYAQD